MGAIHRRIGGGAAQDDFLQYLPLHPLLHDQLVNVDFELGLALHVLRLVKVRPYQVAMKNLMTMLNEEILKSKGMYAKILTFGGLDDSGETPLKGRDSNALPVLVFALTSKEKRRLEAESEKDKNWQCWDCPAHAGRVL